MAIAEKILKIFKKQDERYKDLIARVEALEDRVNVIKFYFNATEYKAKAGMTWGAWCNSEYNTQGLRVDGSFGMIYDGGYPVGNNDTATPVSDYEPIVEGCNYYTMW